MLFLMAVNHCCIDLKHSVRGSARRNVRKVYISYTRKLVCLLFHNMVPELGSLSAAAESHLVADERCNPAAFPGTHVPWSKATLQASHTRQGSGSCGKAVTPQSRKYYFQRIGEQNWHSIFKREKRNCRSQGSCGMWLLIFVGSERARVPRKMKLVFQILLHISSALNKAFLA